MKRLSTILIALFLIQTISAQKAATVRQNDKFGYIKEDGSWLIEPTYLKAGDFHSGLAPVYNGEKWGYINQENELVIEYNFTRAKAFDSGIGIVQKDERWMYINIDGEEVKFDVKSEKPYDFKDGLAMVKFEGKVGMINTKGDLVIDQIYTKILPFKNGIAKVRLGDNWGFIDKSGAYLLEPKYKSIGKTFTQGVTLSKEGELWGLLINGEFNVVTNAVKIWDFPQDELLAAAMTVDKKIGFIDRSGKWIIEPTFVKVRKFSDGLAPVYMGEKKWGYIDETGKVVIDIKFRDGEIFSEGMAPVKLKKLWGFIDLSGNLVVEDIYNITSQKSLFSIEAKGFIDGLAKVKNKEGVLFINKKGEVLGDQVFQMANEFTDIEN